MALSGDANTAAAEPAARKRRRSGKAVALAEMVFFDMKIAPKLIVIAYRDSFRSIRAICQTVSIIMSESNQITGRQIAAARALAGIGQADLAAASKISVPTLRRMEASEGQASGIANNVAAVRNVLEASGVEFIPENGGGAGVRLRKSVIM
jgi:hypothetical protein